MSTSKKCFHCENGMKIATLFGDKAVGGKCGECDGTGWNTKYTDEICCPFCGYEHSDSWELRSDDGDTDCGSCGKTFTYRRNVTVDYVTSPGPDCIRDEEKHCWQKISPYPQRDGKSYVRCTECYKYTWKEIA